MQAARHSMNPPRRGKGNEKIPTIQSGFFWCTFRDSTRLCRVALPHGLSPHGTALRHCPMLRFAFSATGGAPLRIPVTRISVPMEFEPLKHTSKEKTMKLSSHRFSFGALSGTRTRGPLIKSQLLSQLTNTNGVVKIFHVVLLPRTAYKFLAHGL